jgi:hypothetical protein
MALGGLLAISDRRYRLALARHRAAEDSAAADGQGHAPALSMEAER